MLLELVSLPLVLFLPLCCFHFHGFCGDVFSWTSAGGVCTQLGIYAFPFWPMSFVKQEVWKAASDHLLKCVEHLAAGPGPLWLGCHSVFITVAFCSRGAAGTGGLAASLHCSHAPHSHSGCALRESFSLQVGTIEETESLWSFQGWWRNEVPTISAVQCSAAS